MSSRLSSDGLNNTATIMKCNTHPGSGASTASHRITSRVSTGRPSEITIVEHDKRPTAVCDENCLECVCLREK